MKTPFWEELYKTVSITKEKFKTIPSVMSVFNSNIDAIVKVSPERFENWCTSFDTTPVSDSSPTLIDSTETFLEGFMHCFSNGVAQELLISDENLFTTINEVVGYDHLQMGGQGGIIANVMSVAGIQNVLVHAASLPEEQSSLFLDNENLLCSDSNGIFGKACETIREADIPLIHWILEFKKGDTISINGMEYSCPKSNRFIATWDPQNFRLAIDPTFVTAVEAFEKPISYCLLSGYQMLTEPLSDGSSALSRITESKEIVDKWRSDNPDMCVHFEFASTGDINVRKMLYNEMISWADSIGCNEQELIDLLEVLGNSDLAQQCRDSLAPEKLTEALIFLFKSSNAQRIQLHFFGMYLTIQENDYVIDAPSNLEGMAFAATAAASKAYSGAIDTNDSLIFASKLPVKGEAISAINAINSYIRECYDSEVILEKGYITIDNFTLIALPTILVDDPVTLVGMGDTISSLSLVGAGL